VVLALTLFFAAASIVLTGTNRSIRAVSRLRRDIQATDMAVTLLSEIQMGLVEPADAGPEEYEEPLENWTWEIITTVLEEQPVEEDVMLVEIVITHSPTGYQRRLVHWLPTDPAEMEEPLEEDDPADVLVLATDSGEAR
jgi:hypothetical protein